VTEVCILYCDLRFSYCTVTEVFILHRDWGFHTVLLLWFSYCTVTEVFILYRDWGFHTVLWLRFSYCTVTVVLILYCDWGFHTVLWQRFSYCTVTVVFILYRDWGFHTVLWLRFSYCNVTEVFILYCDWGFYTVLWLRFFLTWLRFFSYPDWGFSVLFPQLQGKCQGKIRKDGARTALFHISLYLCCSDVIICVVLLLFVLFNVLFVCKCVLPPGDNPIAVNKYIA
jgi:hypothetical protein